MKRLSLLLLSLFTLGSLVRSAEPPSIKPPAAVKGSTDPRVRIETAARRMLGFNGPVGPLGEHAVSEEETQQLDVLYAQAGLATGQSWDQAGGGRGGGRR